MNKELKPCPFCGGKVDVCEYEYSPYRNAPELLNHTWWVVCRKCGCKVNFGEPVGFYNKSTFVESITERWNTRKPMDDIVEQLNAESYSIGCAFSPKETRTKYIKTIDAIQILKGSTSDE